MAKENNAKYFNLKEISSSLGGPIHNLITAITIFKNNPQITLGELTRRCNKLNLPKLMNKTNSNNYKEEITKRFLEDGYDDLEESLKPWMNDLLTAAQKSKVTFTLFSTVALFAIFTVAAPTFLPCPVLDETQRRALLEQHLKEKKLNSRKAQVLITPRDDNVLKKIKEHLIKEQ
nr:5316_t:CDS:2 [Entrophospora candida]